eukprot:12926286-Prorocentrum_lima.AAC.1
MKNGPNGCRKWMLSCSFALGSLRKASTSIEGAKASNGNGSLCPRRQGLERTAKAAAAKEVLD